LDVEVLRVGHNQHAHAAGDVVQDVLDPAGLGLGPLQILLLALVGLGDVGLDDEDGVPVVPQVVVLDLAAHHALGVVEVVSPDAELAVAAPVQLPPHLLHRAGAEVGRPVQGIDPGLGREAADGVEVRGVRRAGRRPAGTSD
jgi:hypothetical protein